MLCFLSVCVCVCGFFLLSPSHVLLFSSRPCRVTNSMKEVIIGRSSSLPGGSTCIWIQALALSQDLSGILYLCHSFSYFILCFSPSRSYMPSLRMLIALSALTWYDKSFRPFWVFHFCKIQQSFSSHYFPLLSIQYNTTPAPPTPTPIVLKGTCQAMPLKGVHLIDCLPPSFLQFPLLSRLFPKPKRILNNF